MSEASTRPHPELIDTHVHLWDPRSTPRAVSPLVRALGFSPRLLDWAAQRLFPADALRFYASPRYLIRPYAPADLGADLERSSTPPTAVVHVEAGWEGDPVDETRWLEALVPAATHELAAIVARADLTAPDLDATLRGHLDASDRVVGIREVLLWHPNTGVLDVAARSDRMRDPRWRRGFERLAEYGLGFEATVYSNQLEQLDELAAAYPEQTIVLCHAGIPVGAGGSYADLGHSAAERASIVARWREAIARLASRGNVSVKISGLTMPVLGFGFERRDRPVSEMELAEAIAPFVAQLIASFGADRCMFGSNYPVDKVSVPYAALVGAYQRCIADRPESEREALLAGTARRIYRLG